MVFVIEVQLIFSKDNTKLRQYKTNTIISVVEVPAYLLQRQCKPNALPYSLISATCL